MIDINLLRENPKIFKANQKKKGQPTAVVDKVLKIDSEWRKLKQEADKLRHERNKISEEINQAKKQNKKSEITSLLKKAKEIPNKLAKLQIEENKVRIKLIEELSKIHNLIDKKVPLGKSEKDNKVIRKVGVVPKFNFNPKTHVELIESLAIGDFNASAKTSGNGFYYLEGKLALLNQALIRFAIDFMKSKGYHYIETPLMIKKDVLGGALDIGEFKNTIYEIKDTDLVLIGTAEHALLALHANETLPESHLPKKYYSYSMCFRKEIGAHGINEKGLWRTHQFNKVEQFIFCKPEESEKFYDELLKNSEDIIKKLKLPYRVLEMCSGDLSSWKNRQHDIEVYRPTTKDYGEVGSLSNCTDYQARKLNIKVVDKHGNRQTLHTLNNTAIATSRILVAILENYQNKDGSVTIPTCLQKYTGFKKIEKQ